MGYLKIKKESAILLTIFLVVVVVLTLIFSIKNQKGAEDSKEIERKWLISNVEDIPYDLSKAKKHDLVQTYISYSPEIRLRKVNDGEYYLLTIKSDMSVDGLVRNEQEYYISKEEYEHLLTKKEGRSIHKTRYSLPDGKKNTLEFDIFLDDLDGLVYLEIEFDNEREAKEFSQPNWIKKDVTDDKRYKNQSLSQFGIPEE